MEKVFNEFNEKFELIGRVYSEDGIYRPDPITFTLLEGKSISQGEVVCIKHPYLENTYVFYQVVEVPLRRKAKDYEEDLVKTNKIFPDPERNYPRALAEQIGYIDPNTRELKPLLEHIRPLMEVYRPPRRIVEELLKPDENGIYLEIGKVYPHEKLPLYLDLRILLRQGLLIIGGVGTGKTTTMIALIIKLLRTCHEHGLNPHILIVDKDGEYGCNELIEIANLMNGYEKIDVNDLVLRRSYSEPEGLYKELMKFLGLHPSSTAARVLRALIETYVSERKKVELTLSMVDELISIIRKQNFSYKVKAEILDRLKEFRALLERTGVNGYSPMDIISLLKEKTVVHIDCSKAESWSEVVYKLASLFDYIYEEALKDKNFGCLLVIDEAHFYVPERGTFSPAGDAHKSMEDVLVGKIATTGARNGIVVFATTQRLSLVKKTFSTQIGQNLIAHKVEDIDLERLKEIAGPTLAEVVRILPRGYALVKATANPLKRPMIVRIEKIASPLSSTTTCLDRWRS